MVVGEVIDRGTVPQGTILLNFCNVSSEPFIANVVLYLVLQRRLDVGTRCLEALLLLVEEVEGTLKMLDGLVAHMDLGEGWAS